MPATTIPGLGSGIDTEKIIQQLREVESEPIKRLQKQQEELGYQNQALVELKKRTLRLQKALKELYNFDSPFEKKIVYSDPKGLIDGVANKNATAGEYKLEVLNLATRLKFHSRPVKKDESLAETEITVNEESKTFGGGSLDDLKAFLNDNFDDLLTAKTIVKGSGSKIILIESKKEGAGGMLSLSDSAGMLREIELIGAGAAPGPDKEPPPEKKPEPKEESEAISFDLTRLSVVEEGPATVDEKGNSMEMSEKGRRRLELGLPEAADPLKQIKEIRLKVSQKKEEPKEEDPGPFRIHEGPVDTLNIKGIELDSYNIDRLRPQPEIEPEEFDFGVALPGGKDRSFSDKDGIVTIPVNEAPDYLDFYTDNADVTFSDVEVVYEVEPEPQTQDQVADAGEEGKDDPASQQKKLFPHLVDPAQDARLKVDGVEVTREGNEKLTDLIEGASIDLRRASKGPVSIFIEGDKEKSLDKVNEFIDAYNDLLVLVRDVSKAVKSSDVGEYKKNKEEAGLLVTNSTVRLMLSGLRRRVFDAYPAFREPQLRILSSVGIDPYSRNDDPELAMTGFIKLNQERFLEVLAENPQAMREFFGVDSNGDSRMDNGMAFMTVEYLRAYTRPTGGLIGNQVKSNKERIAALDKEILKKEEHVEHYVQGLKKKFGNMEGTIREQKATEQYLRQRFRQGGNK